MGVENGTLPDLEALELSSAVRDHLDKLGIDEVGFDFDNTLIDTATVYANAIREAVEILVDDPENNDLIQENDDYLREAIGKMRGVFRVNPLIMEYSTLAVAVKLDIDISDERVGRAIERMRRIFSTDTHELFSGATNVLSVFDQPTLYTHAGKEWTERKIQEAGIEVLLGERVCMDVDNNKSDQWEIVLARREVDPVNFLMVGDNFDEEILPILVMGGRAIFVDRTEMFAEIFSKLTHKQKEVLSIAINSGKFAFVRRLDRVPSAFLGMR